MSDTKQQIASYNRAIAEIFSGDNTMIYISKKTERLTTAVYLLTNHLEVHEPLRRKLRELALSILSKSVGHTILESSNAEKILHHLYQVGALISVTAESGMISISNAQLLQKEVAELAEYFMHAREQAGALSEEHFEVEKPQHLHTKGTEYKRHRIKDKQVSTRIGAVRGISRRETVQKQQARKRQLTALIRKKGRISVRDAAAEITDCSEKTLQRELLRLVAEGILQKEGERRWSTYILS